MTPCATIRILEQETSEDCVAIVRYSAGKIALALSRSTDGDAEVVFTAVQTRELINALSKALEEAERNASEI